MDYFFVLIYYICNPIMLKIRNQTDVRILWFNIALKMLNQESDSVPLLRPIPSPWSRSLQTGPFLGVGELGDRPGPRIHGGLASGGKGNAMMKIKVGITPNKRLHGPGLMVFGGSSPRWGPGMDPDGGTRWGKGAFCDAQGLRIPRSGPDYRICLSQLTDNETDFQLIQRAGERRRQMAINFISDCSLKAWMIESRSR